MSDAVAIKTPSQRGPWNFFITGTNRGVRQDPLVGEYTVYYDARARSIQLTDEEARVVTQKFDNHDRVTERTFPEGNKVQFAYDDATQQVKQITQIPKSTAYYSTVLPNIVVSATYDSTCAKVKTITDARLKVTTWNYNTTTCTLTNVQQPQVPNPEVAGSPLATPQTSYLYNSFGQLTQVTDPTARVVTLDYDATTHYRLRRHVNPAALNLTTAYGHNAYGDVNSVTDPRSNVTAYTFDKQRRLTQISAPLGSTTKNFYDLDGDVIRVERAMNLAQTQWQVWLKTLTPTKKVETETSPTGDVTAHQYDALDRESVVIDAAGRKVRTEFFKDGKTKKITRAHQSTMMPSIVYATYTLSLNGQINTVTDANGSVTNLDYDGFDRPARTFFPDPATGVPCGPALPHSAAAPSCGATQKYGELGYDASGNITSKRNRSGAVIGFVLDDLNRETTRNVPANSMGHFARTLTNTYDLASRKYDATADGQTISHRYDAASRVDFVTDSYLAPTGTTDYAYDAAGNRTTLAYPGGTTVTYTYDAVNRMDTVAEGGAQLADYDWDPLSRRDLVKLNGAAFSMDYGYEDDDDLSSLVHTGPVPVTFTLGRNGVGQITSLAASDGAFLSRPPTAVTHAYAANRLNQVATLNATTLAYDANGNLTNDSNFTFEYDEENRLRSIAGTGMTATYEYDPLGRRRTKVVNGVSTKFVSDVQEEVEERDGSNAVLRRYAYGSGVDDRVAMLDAGCAGGGRCFYLANWQGSTTALVQQSNVLKDIYHYGPYGENGGWTPLDASTGNPYRFTGRRLDPETGLYYYRARFYSPSLGRFLQTDPVGVEDDLNVYSYVLNDPLNLLDPTGTESGEDCSVVANKAACHARRAKKELEERKNTAPGMQAGPPANSTTMWEHYRGGTGDPARVSFSDVDTSEVTPSQFQKVQDELAKGPREASVVIDGTRVFSTTGDEANFLGNVVLRLQGILIVREEGTWQFKGTLKSYDDTYDFNKGSRGVLKEVMTWVGRISGGATFDVEIRGAKSISETGRLP